MSVKLKHLMVLSRAFTAPSGNEGIKELEVYNFTGAGGIALSMYNTDEVCIKEFNLKQMWRSPNGTIRNILNGN